MLEWGDLLMDKRMDEMTKEELRDILNLAECGILLMNISTEPEILYANDCFYRYLQYTPEEFRDKMGRQLMAVVVPQERQKLKSVLARQRSMGGRIRLEIPVIRKDGSRCFLGLSARCTDGMIYECSCQDITESKQHLEDAFRAKREMEMMANNIPGGVVKLRMSDMKILYANDGFYRLAGYSRAEYSYQFQNCASGPIYPGDKERIMQVITTAVENRGTLGMEYRILAKNGEVRWSYANGARVDDEDGEIVYQCVIVDITSRKKAEEELWDNNRRSARVTKMLHETVWSFDSLTHEVRKEGSLRLICTPEDIFLAEPDKAAEIAGKYMHPDDVPEFLKLFDRWGNQEGSYHAECRLLNDVGEYQRAEMFITVEKNIHHPESLKIYGVTRVVGAAEKALEEAKKRPNMGERLLELAHKGRNARRDMLTGLLPYGAFLGRAEQMLRNRQEGHLAVMCADINEFRRTSMVYGYSISNELLRLFSKILKENLVDDGVCTRVDGDFFVAVFRYEDYQSLVEAVNTVIRYQEQIRPGKEERSDVIFGVTVGLYLLEEEESELSQMLEKADIARRSIKGMRGSHYALYTPDMLKQKSHETDMEEQICEAMRNHELEVNYMPRIQGDVEHVVGCKIVPSLQLKEGQFLDSKRLLHLASKGGFAEDYSLYVLHEAAMAIRGFGAKAKGKSFAIEMAGNALVGKQSAYRIHDIIVGKNGLDPGMFMLEIPERYMASDRVGVQAAVTELAKLGYKVIISQFGSVHTSLNPIRNLPVSGLKFHGESLSERQLTDRDIKVLGIAVRGAKEMGMTVACGGIHNKLQEEYAREIGCDALEGDLYFGPMRANVFEKCFLEK